MANISKGSIWRVWDLQVQTILDDGYQPLRNYYEELKSSQAHKWQIYVDKIGGEVNALLFDSKEYFNDATIPIAERCINYARNLFSYIEVFKPELGLIGFTDHNYSHDILIDQLFHYSKKTSCKCLCGVEINASGVHILAFFEKPPLSKATFSEGIKSFLDSININQPKRNGVLTVSDQSVGSVIQAITDQGGVYIFPHCNSDNGLFQERAKTDRTYLADIYNAQPVILLQASSSDLAKKTSEYISSKPKELRSKHVFSISADSRRLFDIGKNDNRGCYTWVKADTTFQGLKQIIIENDRVEIAEVPGLIKRVNANKTKFIKSLKVNKIADTSIADIWFDDFYLPLNSGLVAVIGNKGSGKSAIADIIGLCGNTYQEPKQFSFLTSSKFRKLRPINLSEKFEAFLEWEDSSVSHKKLNQDPDKNLPERVKYIPQSFLESVCANVESDQFERELKQIIYHHTPSEQRFNKASLDELIEYKSNLINDEILGLKSQLTKLNTEIAFLEHKTTIDYRVSVENQIKLKEDELKAHETNIPVQPSATTPTKNEEEVAALNVLRESQEHLEAEIREHLASKTALVLSIEELMQASQHYNTLRDQLNRQLEESNSYIQILTKNNISVSDVFSFTIETQPILDKIDTQTTSLTVLNELLDETKENSKAFNLARLIQQISDSQDSLDKPAKDQQKYLSDLKHWTDRKNEIEGDKETEGSLNYYRGQLEYLTNEVHLKLASLYEQRKLICVDLFSKKQALTNERKRLFEPVTKFIDDFKELKDRYDVKFDVTLELRNFSENFFGFINQGKIGSFYGREEGHKRLTEITDRATFNSVDNFIAFAESLVSALKNSGRNGESLPIEISTQLKSGKQINELYDFIFSFDYLQPIYNLKLGDKTLQELSPGERGALLLIFYLILDNDDIPLIIDQPEENLDNESVYHILVHFIKKVKEKRQIVIVTHNPNLAVVCDADQIIHMQIDKKDKNRVNFKSGAIEDIGINKAVINVLEGTMPAFSNRDSKYIR